MINSVDLGIIAATFLCADLLTRLSVHTARRCGAMDLPGPIKSHTHATPRLGGVAIVIPASLYLLLRVRIQDPALCRAMALGGLAFAAVGVLDDIRSLSPPAKLTGQCLASLLAAVWCSGSLAGLLGSAFVMLAYANAANLFDGMDGLLAVTSFVSLLFLGLSLAYIGQHEAAVTSFVISTATLGFLVHNWPPARTFMGDTGSLYLGFCLGTLSTRLAYTRPSWYAVVACALSGYLILVDMAFSVFRRWKRGRLITSGDRQHIYDNVNRRLQSPVLTLAVFGAVATALCVLAYLILRSESGLLAVLSLAGIGAATVAVALRAPWVTGMAETGSKPWC